MEFGNSCAIICRFVLIILLILGIILSSMIIPSCHFISAITHNDETHGVGLQTFEDEKGSCVPHNTFVIKNYNGMELVSKVGAYVAPTCASLVVATLLLECFQKSCWGGKCLPFLLLLGATVCQGLTFLLFQSELFCSNKDIAKCDLGSDGFRSVQATLVYSFCWILYYCGPNPMLPGFMRRTQPVNESKKKKKKKKKERYDSSSSDESTTRGSSKRSSKKTMDESRGSSKKSGKSKKSKNDKPVKTEPGPGEDWTKEMYEARRKERKVKSRGVSGRSKKEIYNDRQATRSGSQRAQDERGEEQYASYEHSIVSYDPNHYNNRRNSNNNGGDRDRSPVRYDDYVDTEPDGMDWSAFTPNQREAYYDRQRRKKKERKERERREREERERDLERGRYDESPRTPTGGGEDYSSRGGNTYDDSYRRSGGSSQYDDDDYTRDDTYYSNDRDHRSSGYNQSYRSSGNGRSSGGGYHDDYIASPDDYTASPGSATRDSRDYQSRGGGDYDSYTQGDDYDSYAQSYARGDEDSRYERSGEDFSYADDSRRGGGDGGGGGGGRSGSRYDDDSYYDDPSYISYDNRRGY